MNKKDNTTGVIIHLCFLGASLVFPDDSGGWLRISMAVCSGFVDLRLVRGFECSLNDS